MATPVLSVPTRTLRTLERVSCPACASSDSRRLAEEFGLGIRQCDRCELVYVSPRRVDAQQHYHGDRAQILAKYGPVLRGEQPHNRDPNYREELAVLARLKPTGRLLDIGTHCGLFLRLARGMGWELSGVEPSPAADLAREFFGLNVRRGHLEELALPTAHFDVITLLDVIEHLDRPHRLLAEVRRVLKPDGVLFIKTPNAGYTLFKHALIHRVLGLHQVDVFDAKEHVVQYTRATLGRALSQARFEVFEAFIPRPVQDGAAWKCALRSTAHGLARTHSALSGEQFGPLAMDLAILAQKSV